MDDSQGRRAVKSEGQMFPCNAQAEVLVCAHVSEGQKPDVLHCADDGTIESATCKDCADLINSGEMNDTFLQQLLTGVCRRHFEELTGIDWKTNGGGFFLLNETFPNA